MNILVIGNGFDLAHGLPTSYPDFLAFCKMLKAVCSTNNNENADVVWRRLNISLREQSNTILLESKFQELFSQSIKEGKKYKTNTLFDEMYDNIDNNFWIEYFGDNVKYQKENWIDFESEISSVIQSLDANMKNENSRLEDEALVVSNSYVEKFFHARLSGGVFDFDQSIDIITFKEIRDILYKDLNRLIRAFELYLLEYVKKIKVKMRSPDIGKQVFDHVLSFNYTNTYKEYYGNSKVLYDYIHGEAKSDNTLETNNMVLGIDEYLSTKKRNKQTDFIAFKKYFQRIYKETGNEYQNWVYQIKESGKSIEMNFRNSFPLQIPYSKFTDRHYVYIFGHSLDVTDKDILRELILNDNVYTTIYYHNKEVMGQQITNLVKVIGQDELIRRTGGSTKTIEFKKQAEMYSKK